MKLLKRILLFFLLIGLLALAYYFSRAYIRLPFDRVSVWSAVENSSELLVQLPELTGTAPVTDTTTAWYADEYALREMIDSLELGRPSEWNEWWLLPQAGKDNETITFLFIGSADGLGKLWQPTKYGPSLPFPDGEIYAYGLTSNRPIYFARFHNLLLVGNYPFQLERALLAAQEKMVAWDKIEGMQAVVTASENELGSRQVVMRNTERGKSNLTQIFGNTQLLADQQAWSWASLQLRPGEQQTQLSGKLWSTAAILPNITSGTWSNISPSVRSARPLVLGTPGAASELTTWLGEGAWTIEPDEPASAVKVAPKVWILPIGDSTSYAAFRRKALASSGIIEQVTHQLFDLQQWQSAGAFASLSNRKLWQPWVCELPDRVLLSVYREDLEKYLDFHLLGANIQQEDDFLRLWQALPPTEQLSWQAFVYWPPLRENESNLFAFLFPQFDWAKSGQLLLQAEKKTNQLYELRGVIQTAPERSGSAINWTLSLPTSEQVRLLPVRDEKENLRGILVSTANGQVWAYNLAGQELWRNSINDRLYDPILAIRYSSGVERWIAASSADIYNWDDNGSDQAGPAFKGILPTAAPIRLLFPAVDQAMIAFPTAEGALQLRYLNGNVPNGWPVQLPEAASQSLLHLSQAEEDLIIAHTPNFGWQVVGSQGDLQLTSGDSLSTATIGQGYLSQSTAGGSLDRLVRMQADGKLRVQALNGERFSLLLGRGPVDNYVQLNCWGDDRPDYLVQRGSLLHLFAYAGKEFTERWQYRLPTAVDRIVAAPPLGVLAISDSRKEIWLIDGDGKLLDGFPLAGEGTTFLGGNATDGFQLVTSLDRRIYVYGVY